MPQDYLIYAIRILKATVFGLYIIHGPILSKEERVRI
jgi:hypothetical protein